jgi:hypothetical protein
VKGKASLSVEPVGYLITIQYVFCIATDEKSQSGFEIYIALKYFLPFLTDKNIISFKAS